MNNYDWITADMFGAKLAELVDDMSAAEILAVPGAYEVLAEELNNAVLLALRCEREFSENIEDDE